LPAGRQGIEDIQENVLNALYVLSACCAFGYLAPPLKLVPPLKLRRHADGDTRTATRRRRSEVGKCKYGSVGVTICKANISCLNFTAMKRFLFLQLLFPTMIMGQPGKQITMSFDSLFQSYFKSGEPGGAVLIVKNNIVIYEKGFGIADIHTKEAITPQTLFNVGSISKTFVAYGILSLAKENKLALDDELYKYFPDFKNKTIAKKVKLYNLLTHTSGIPDNRPIEEQHDFYLTAKDAENFAPLKQTDSLQFEPGTHYKYSNPAFNGLALIIEKLLAGNGRTISKTSFLSQLV
jgi:CubicO group peptidase (beta-lactamase class C family)